MLGRRGTILHGHAPKFARSVVPGLVRKVLPPDCCLLAAVRGCGRGQRASRQGPALVAAMQEAREGATIELAAGIFELEAPLELKAGMTLKGAGKDRTILTHAASWKPSTQTLPDPEMTTKGLDTSAYLIRLKDNAVNITVSDFTLSGPQLPGAIYGWGNSNLHLHHLRIQDTLWSGIRTFLMRNARIHDCEFIDAGGRWERGEPGLKSGITGGAIFSIWMADTEIAHNRFTRTQMGRADEDGKNRHQTTTKGDTHE